MTEAQFLNIVSHSRAFSHFSMSYVDVKVSPSRLNEILQNSLRVAHKAAVGCAEVFLRVQEGKMPSISQQLSDIYRNTVELNRQKLRSIIKTVALCGKHNIALRGHRDDSSHIDEASGNPGNFQALLNFRVEAGDKVLTNHFANAQEMQHTALRRSKMTS